MTKLEKITLWAQRDADREGCTLQILNLNRFSPMYVIRSLTPAQTEAAKAAGQWVATITPKVA